MFERLLPNNFCRKFMTEMGKELEESMLDDNWAKNQHTLTHEASRTELWIANDYAYFRLYRVGNNSHENQLRGLLNRFDRCVIWRAYQQRLKVMYRKEADKLVNEALNTLRLGRIKERGNV